MDAEDKERLIEEFRACLDDWEDESEDGDGQGDSAGDDEPIVNLALLFSELSVLRNEVRTEARQFKTTLDDMRALTELLNEQNKRLSRDLERARESDGHAQRQTERRLLLDMLDVRDRIGTAVAVFRDYQPSFLRRFAPTETKLALGLGEGIELTLRRLDDLLLERRVRAIETVGARLDPNTMRAVGVEHVTERVTGEVLREARRGYMRDEELLRVAEVIVNKHQ
jgi:molecular chaperone GrpE